MKYQMDHHKTIVDKINKDMGAGATAHLKQCLYSVYVGSNDWMLNFFSGGSVFYLLNPYAYGNSLRKELSGQITVIIIFN